MEEQALIKLLLVEQPGLLAYIRSIVRRADLADDVFQDVCVLAVQKRGDLVDDGLLVRWLRVTARLTAMNHLRKRREEHLVLDEAALDALEAGWDDADVATDTEELQRCLRLLPPHQRDLVTKRFVDDYDYRRLAAEYQRPVNSLYVTFSRIYAALAKCLANHKRLTPEVRRG